MLVLSRKPNEQIVIGNDIVITVLAVHPGHVRLGVEAPRSISVHRQEVYQDIVQKKLNAGPTGRSDTLGKSTEPSA